MDLRQVGLFSSFVVFPYSYVGISLSFFHIYHNFSKLFHILSVFLLINVYFSLNLSDLLLLGTNMTASVFSLLLTSNVLSVL